MDSKVKNLELTAIRESNRNLENRMFLFKVKSSLLMDGLDLFANRHLFILPLMIYNPFYVIMRERVQFDFHLYVVLGFPHKAEGTPYFLTINCVHLTHFSITKLAFLDFYFLSYSLR